MEHFLELAAGLADTLAGLHGLGIVHKNISPAHIVCNPAGGRFYLIGFSRAGDLPLRTVPLQLPAALEGELDYISPEGTGRINRAIDHRSDLYSLGATFYRLLAGKPPFRAANAADTIRCHIAAAPPPLHEAVPGIPMPVSRIVMKLLAKAAGDRYQSSWGLKADLDCCLRELRKQGTVPDFELGVHDFSERLEMPQKLYGWQQEVAQLLAAFERALTGQKEFMLVRGGPGSGKSALVHEIQRYVAGKDGLFIAGRFDPQLRGVPYAGWKQAFAGLVTCLLGESEPRLADWRRIVLAAAGSAGKALTHVIPNLELIIGPQPDAPELELAQAQNRLNRVFLRFVAAIAAQRPLVIFLDSLQWADPASLDLLQTLLTGGGVSSALVIGAYRDNEIDATHPLTETLKALRVEGITAGTVTTGILSRESIGELIADTFNRNRTDIEPFARLLFSKTGGNPFLVLETLITLAESNAISADVQQRRWQWDIPALKTIEVAGDGVSSIQNRLRKLPRKTQHIVLLSACLGFRFDLAELSIAAGEPAEAVLASLRPALREGLIVALNGTCQFAHDCIHKAAYALNPDAARKKAHRAAGKLLLQRLGEQDRDERLYIATGHLNASAEPIDSAAGRLMLARLNVYAGSEAKACGAFSTAASYLEAGIALLGSDPWQSQYDLAAEAFLEAIEAEYLAARYERAARWQRKSWRG